MTEASFSTSQTSTGTGFMPPMKRMTAVVVLSAGSLLAAPTTAGVPFVRPTAAVASTTSGAISIPVNDPSRRRGASALMRVRQLTGLTWDQLSTLFSVTRRSIFLWASGKPMSAENEEFLARLLALVDWMDRGSVLANRDLLMSRTADGLIVLDLVAEGRFDEARAQVGPPATADRRSPPPLSGEARREREPLGPAELLGALQDSIRTAPERVLSTRRIRRPARA